VTRREPERRAVAADCATREDDSLRRIALLAWLVGAAAIAVAAVVARGAFLGERQLFRDEAASWLVAGLPLADLVARVATEPYPPLYHVLLRGWLAVVPASEATLRLPSVVAGLVAVVVGWRWAHEALGRWPGLIAAAVLALSPLALANARDTRMYAFETAFAVTAWWLTWRLISGRAGGRGVLVHGVVLAAVVAGELWTLALGLGAAGLQGLVALIALLVALRQRPPGDAGQRRGALAAVIAIAAGGLLFLPWLPGMLGLAAGHGEFWTEPVESLDWLYSLQEMLGGAFGWVPGEPSPQRLLLIVAELGVVGACLDRRIGRRCLGWCLLAGVAFVPLVWAISLVRSIYDTRYLAAALPAVALGIAGGADVLGRVAAAALSTIGAGGARQAVRATTMAAIALVAVWTTGLGAYAFVSDWRRERGLPPTRQVLDAVESRLQPGDVLLAADARSYFPLAWELHRRGLDVPAWDWEPPGEPFFRGHALLDAGTRVTPEEATAGWEVALPGLGRNGRIWLIALANDRDEDLHFAPLADGEMREVERVVVEPVDEAGQARALELVRR
jgi:hypothetical protein